jgi:integrase
VLPDDFVESFLQTEELLKIWEHKKIAALFAVLAYAGIRSGEARAFCWKDYIESNPRTEIQDTV